jgi:hypothetical protein
MPISCYQDFPAVRPSLTPLTSANPHDHAPEPPSAAEPRTWWLVNTFHLGPQGRFGEVTHHSWNRIDPGNYGINTDRFTRAALAANAREYGDEHSAQALEASLADRLVEQHGARRYQGISV